MYHPAYPIYRLITKAVESRKPCCAIQPGKRMKQILKNLVRDDSGQDMIEYALVSTLLALSLLAVIRSYNVHVVNIFGGIGTSLTNAIS